MVADVAPEGFAIIRVGALEGDARGVGDAVARAANLGPRVAEPHASVFGEANEQVRILVTPAAGQRSPTLEARIVPRAAQRERAEAKTRDA